MKRLVSLLATAAVLGTALLLVTATPTIAAGGGFDVGSAGTCDDWLGVNQHVGAKQLPRDPIVLTGMRATIKYGNDLYECTGVAPFDTIRGVSAWVGVEAGLNDPGPSDEGQNIIQIGMTKCHSGSPASYSPCYGSRAGQLRYFWAWGRNCPGYSVVEPDGHDLGPADNNAHEYRVIWDKDNYVINFYVDSTVKAILDVNYVYCWLNKSYNYYTAQGERFDSNDGIGTDADRLLLRSMRYGQYTEGWRTTDFTDLNCFKQAPEFHCNISNTDPGDGAIWTDLQ